MRHALILDAFETIIEKPVYHDLWRPIIKRASVQPPDPMITPLGLRAFAAAAEVDWDPEWEALLNAELSAIRIIPEMEGALHTLVEHDIPTVIASNLAQPYGEVVRRVLAPFGFATHFSYEERLRKPDPVFLLGACAKVSAAPADCLLIGNSITSDLGGGRAAGIRTLIVGDVQTPNAISRRQMIDVLVNFGRCS